MESKTPPVVGISGCETTSIVGMGVVVDQRHVITCAHVVNYALNRNPYEKDRPSASICVRFILAPQEPVRWAQVSAWLPPADSGENEDLVLLTMEEDSDVEIDQSLFSIPRILEPIRAFGLPDGSKLGKWWRGLVSNPVRGNRFQLDQSEHAKVFLEPGFSGTPLLSNNGRRAYGIVTRVRDGVGYMIPSQEINRVYNVLKSSNDNEDIELSSDENTLLPSDNSGSTITAIAIKQHDSLIEVEIDADSGSFSDDDAFYFQKIIEYMQGFPGVKFKVSYIRKGSTILGFRVISEKADDDASTIVSAINEGVLKQHGVVRASIASYEAKKDAATDIKVSSFFRWKEILDRVLASTLLVAALPILSLLIVLIRFTSKGSAIYSQSRVGKKGRTFSIYKLRTMRFDAEKSTGAVWSRRGDSRVTFLGAILRKTTLDELPQLWNVIRGDMSLIGPRPERNEFVEVLVRIFPDYMSRLSVKPGIWGLTGLYFPPDADQESVRRKVRIDRFYIEHATPWMDFLIFLDVLARMFSIPLRLTKHYVNNALFNDSNTRSNLK